MKRVLYLPLAALLAVGFYLLGLQFTDNMHETLPGELYRSAQLTPAQLESYRRMYGIKSVLNLRGDNTGAEWYDAEQAYTRKAGVTYLNFRMSSKRELSKAQVKELIAMMDAAPKPLLIHCKHGADRTGLAVALYFAAIADKGEEEAESQLSLTYGHIPWISAARAMDETFEAMEPMLGFSDS